MVKLGQMVEVKKDITLINKYKVKKLWLCKDRVGKVYMVMGACFIDNKCYGWSDLWGTSSLKKARQYIKEIA